MRDKMGWVNTQDAGIIHPSGYLQVIGRTSDLISKSGIKVYPISITIENMLLKCDEVRKVAVYGVPDVQHGHEIVACVVPTDGCKPTEETMKSFCDKHGSVIYGIALYPTRFVFVNEFPLSVNGKIYSKKVKSGKGT